MKKVTNPYKPSQKITKQTPIVIHSFVAAQKPCLLCTPCFHLSRALQLKDTEVTERELALD
jgi:hypothetical protein